jgi:hypothetical protein
MAGSFDQGLVNVFTQQYTTNLELLLQQKGSKVRGKVAEGFHVGKMASPINQIGPVVLKKPAGRFAPIDQNRQDPQLLRRWVFPQEGEIVQMIDSFDQLQTIVDPKSGYVTGASYAVGRGWDDAILQAATADAQIGVDAGGLSTETFDTTKFRVADTFGGGGSAVGLTVDKLIETRRIFRHYHNDLDMEELTIIIGSRQEADLLGQVQVVNTLYNDRPVLVDGRVKRFLGFNVEVMERVPEITAATTRGVISFVKSGMYLGMWRDMMNDASQRKDLTGLPWQLYTMVMFGATRTQPGKVIQIGCADTTGSDINP